MTATRHGDNKPRRCHTELVLGTIFGERRCLNKFGMTGTRHSDNKPRRCHPELVSGTILHQIKKEKT